MPHWSCIRNCRCRYEISKISEERQSTFARATPGENGTHLYIRLVKSLVLFPGGDPTTIGSPVPVFWTKFPVLLEDGIAQEGVIRYAGAERPSCKEEGSGPVELAARGADVDSDDEELDVTVEVVEDAEGNLSRKGISRGAEGTEEDDETEEEEELVATRSGSERAVPSGAKSSMVSPSNAGGVCVVILGSRAASKGSGVLGTLWVR